MRISDWSSDVCSSDLAAGLSLQADRADGRVLRSRFRARTDASRDAEPWHILRKIYDRLHRGIPGELVQRREACIRTPRLFAELFRHPCQRAAARLDRKSTRLNYSH